MNKRFNIASQKQLLSVNPLRGICFKRKMKKSIPLILSIIMVGAFNLTVVHAQLLQQKFEKAAGSIFTNSTNGNVVYTGSSTDAYFNNGNPSKSQFDFAAVSSNPEDGALTLTSNAGGFSWNKTTTGVIGEVCRVTNFAATAPKSLVVKATLNFSAITNGSNKAVTFSVGSGFHGADYTKNYGLGYPVQKSTNVNSQFVIQTNSNNGKWGVTNNSANYINNDVPITWVINNSGAALKYTAPGGKIYTLANGTFDLWLDAARDIAGGAATTSGVALNNFAIEMAGGMDSFTLSDLLIDELPK